MYNLDYYKILNVAPKATEAEIKASFIKIRQGASPEDIQKMNEAYRVLSDSNERTKYDQWYKNQGASVNNLGGSPAPKPTPTPAPTPTSAQGVPTGVPSVHQVKILNLMNFSTRVIAVNNIDANKFPPAQYCDNGLYHAIEKNNNISLCNKSQWDSLYRQVIRANTRGQNQPTFGSGNLKKLIIWAIIFIVFIFAVSKCSNDNTSTSKSTSGGTSSYTQSDSSSTTTTPEVEKEPEIEYEEVEKPANGTLSHTYDPYSANTSVLKIELPTYESDNYYYIKLINPTTGETVQSVFLHPGQSKEFSVPCGNFKLRYACGDKWYGYEHLFGPYGGYSGSNELLDFTTEYGHTITLTPVVNGNFSTNDIDFDDF